MEKFNKDFKQPFDFINVLPNYELKNIISIMFNKKLKTEKLDINYINFPKNIVNVYWYDKGIYDEKPWQFIGRIKYKDSYRFVYIIADCDYTGFDCQGSMKLYISKSLKRIMTNAVPKKLFHFLKYIVSI